MPLVEINSGKARLTNEELKKYRSQGAKAGIVINQVSTEEEAGEAMFASTPSDVLNKLITGLDEIYLRDYGHTWSEKWGL